MSLLLDDRFTFSVYVANILVNRVVNITVSVLLTIASAILFHIFFGNI